jgi:hypothetical protein
VDLFLAVNIIENCYYRFSFGHVVVRRLICEARNWFNLRARLIFFAADGIGSSRSGSGGDGF